MSEVTTDHQQIRQWAQSKGGKPAAVADTHGDDDVGIIRIMFPDAPRSEHEGLTEISWDEFFKEFDERELALVYEEDSLFSKLVSRDAAHASGSKDESEAGARQSAEHSEGPKRATGPKSGTRSKGGGRAKSAGKSKPQ